MKFEDGKFAILFNGPKYCGKDTAVSGLMDFFQSKAEIFRFTVPVKDETHRRYGLNVPYDYFEDKSIKDKPMPEFGDLSPRQAYISVGNALREEHGPNIVTEMLCDEIRKSSSSIILNPDCGGDNEAEGIANLLGKSRVLVIRVFKEGHTYEGDCRDWVKSPHLNVVDITNVEGRSEEYVSRVVKIVKSFKNSLSTSSAKPNIYLNNSINSQVLAS